MTSIYTNKIVLLCTIYGTGPPQLLLKIGIIHIWDKIIHFFGRGGGSYEKNSGPVKINILWATASCHFMAQDSVDELVFSISKVSKNSIPISQNLKKKEIIDQ